MGITEIVSILTVIGGAIAGWLKYRYDINKLKSEIESKSIDAQAEFRDDLMSRILQLEDNERKLQIERSEQWAKANAERKAIITDYDDKIDQLRKDTRRKLDEMLVEVSTWRDKYYTLYGEYEKLKVEYLGLDARFTASQKEIEYLKEQLKTKA